MSTSMPPTPHFLARAGGVIALATKSGVVDAQWLHLAVVA
jgi:hypothetical protein